MSFQAILLGPGPYSGRVITVDRPTQVIAIPEPERIKLSDYRARNDGRSPYIPPEGEEEPPGFDPLVIGDSFRRREWVWDGTVNEHGQYRFRTKDAGEDE